MNEDQAKGKIKQGEGKAQEAWGDAKEKADDLWDDLKDKIDGDDKNEDKNEDAERAPQPGLKQER